MAKKLLIDANHPEEVRVAVIDGQTVEDFDSETSTKKQIKGNIYLAKVIRVEPSLQAAFVEFGGNRHGFLPFSEIHPDYYRVPIADRTFVEKEEENVEVSPEILSEEMDEQEDLAEELESVADDLEVLAEEILEEPEKTSKKQRSSRTSSYRYKIQEVIKRRHIMLVQVVKEERGTKGASLTTYLSLPGRYCVLMPNAGSRAGGVSRKINDGEDRRRLRDLVKELEVPEGMALIVRTAGQERNKIEIRRDYEYLLRLWNDIRELTFQSIAPCLIYAEGDLVKRAIRDIYNRDIDEVLVEGEEAYKHAKAFMRQLIPSHARKVKIYKDPDCPLFYRFQVEEQINLMMNPSVRLPSGGSIVINSTEALVAIDVNSGRSTRERHIDETALKTNLEAADEVGRQMRLRDLAGLVVIDFIDMSDSQHIQQVEKRMREAVKNDRARIQLGKISQFGLLELSRQRLRPSLIETYTTACGHCHGTGLVRSVESMALQVLRAIETCALQQKAHEILITVPSGIELYLLNQKRHNLIVIENRFGLSIQVTRDMSLNSPDFRLDVLSLKEEVKIQVSKPDEKTQEKDGMRKNIEQRTSSQSSALPKPDSSYDIKAENEEEEQADLKETNKNRKRRRQRRRRMNRQGMKTDGTSLEGQENMPVQDSETKKSSEVSLVSVEAVVSDSSFQEEEKKKNNSRGRRKPHYLKKRSGSTDRGNHATLLTEEASLAGTMPESEAAVINTENHSGSTSRRRSSGWLRRLLDS